MAMTVDSVREDSYWRAAHAREHYYSPRFDYEDYAPAYCVGYIGFAQYGGSFEEAEKSLWANWVRIKGDSRLPLEHAQFAMRAAWDRLASGQRFEPVDEFGLRVDDATAGFVQGEPLHAIDFGEAALHA